MTYSEIERTLRPVMVEPSFGSWLEMVVRVTGSSG